MRGKENKDLSCSKARSVKHSLSKLPCASEVLLWLLAVFASGVSYVKWMQKLSQTIGDFQQGHHEKGSAQISPAC